MRRTSEYDTFGKLTIMNLRPREKGYTSGDFKFELNPSLNLNTTYRGDEDTLIVNQPMVELNDASIKEVIAAFGLQLENNIDSSKGPPFHVISDKVSFRIDTFRNKEFGDKIFVYVYRDEGVVIDDEINDKFVEYCQNTIFSAQLFTAITSLIPNKIIEKIEQHKKYGNIFEQMYLTPGFLEPSSADSSDYHPDFKYKGRVQYFADCTIIDLRYKYAFKMGVLGTKSGWEGTVMLQGWFKTREELMEALFNTRSTDENMQFTYEDQTSTSIQTDIKKASPTYQRVFDFLSDSSYKKRLERFMKDAQEIIDRYRTFTDEDKNFFKFPSGYEPVTVEVENRYAIGFKKTIQGIELCIQLHSDLVLEQIEDKVSELRNQILILEQAIEHLNNLKKTYNIS